MNSMHRFTIAGLIIALAILMVSVVGHVDAACPDFTINNPTAGTLTMKLRAPTGLLKTFVVAPGVNVFPAFVPVAAQSAGGTNIPLAGNCTPCYAVATSVAPGLICLKWCYDPATCTITMDITSCTPPSPCVP
jgi:hypothetical protein